MCEIVKEDYLAELHIQMIDKDYGKYLTNPADKSKEMKTLMN